MKLLINAACEITPRSLVDGLQTFGGTHMLRIVRLLRPVPTNPKTVLGSPSLFW